MISHPATLRSHCLEVAALSKSFGPRQVVDGLDLTVHTGEIIAIVGRSGCGKSTLLRLIAGLETCDQGKIKAHLSNPLEDLRILFQEPRLLPWKTILDNVRLGQSPERIHEAIMMLDAVGLRGREKEWPLTLSGGQKQRVALARALMSQPSLLLMDEPFGALDALTKLEMHRLFEQIWAKKGFSAIIVTHDVSEALFLADRVMLYERGRISKILEVDLKRPRDRRDEAFARLECHLLDQLVPNN